MLDRALAYFTGEAVGNSELYYSKLRALCPSEDEAKGIKLEKTIRLAEQKRWSIVKISKQELSVNDLEFVSFSESFSGFKRSLAVSVHISFPFTEEQLKSGS